MIGIECKIVTWPFGNDHPLTEHRNILIIWRHEGYFISGTTLKNNDLHCLIDVHHHAAWKIRHVWFVSSILSRSFV